MGPEDTEQVGLVIKCNNNITLGSLLGGPGQHVRHNIKLPLNMFKSEFKLGEKFKPSSLSTTQFSLGLQICQTNIISKN